MALRTSHNSKPRSLGEREPMASADEPRVTRLVVRDGKLHVREVGSGPPVVVLHGGPEFDHEYLLPELDRLAESCRLVYYDQRGRGRSWHGETAADVGLASDLDDLDEIRCWLGMESVTLLGHSWGGLLAVEYALARPQNVAKLVLMNTAPVSVAGWNALALERRSRRSPEQTAALEAVQADPAFQRGDLQADLAYLRLVFSGSVNPPELLEALLPRFHASFTPEGVLAAREIDQRLYEDTWADPGYDRLYALRALTVRTLLLHGDDDFVPRTVVEDIAEATRDARLVLIPGGHFSYLEQPELVKQHVTSFLVEEP